MDGSEQAVGPNECPSNSYRRYYTRFPCDLDRVLSGGTEGLPVLYRKFDADRFTEGTPAGVMVIELIPLAMPPT